jgi:hypothetical protein
MIPVVFIHKGNSKYLFNTIYQFKKTNPSAKVYLIGTPESAIYQPLVEHVSIDLFSDEARQFEQVYKHFSTNSEAFELMCIQRWFVLKAFMIHKGMERCLYLDSDVLVYDDIQRLSEMYAHVGMTLCGISGHTNFINKNILIDFCSFINALYLKQDALDTLELYYRGLVVKHGAGGVSDMTLLTNYATEYPQNVQNTYYLNGQPSFDPAMEVGAEYFEMDKGIKKIFFKDSKPFATFKLTNKPVLFYTLHLQGSKLKKNMLTYIPVKTMHFWVQYATYISLYYIQKIQRKMANK